MKAEFVKPSMEMVEIDKNDVIATSGCPFVCEYECDEVCDGECNGFSCKTNACLFV